MRILVTGSRLVTVEDRPILEDGLREVVGNDPGPHVLVHGMARGADTVFAQIAGDWGWTVEGHAATWDAPCRPACREPGGHGERRPNQYGSGTYCPAAGHFRNDDMVSLGADKAISAYKRGAKNVGTSDCVGRIRAAGIDVHRVVVP